MLIFTELINIITIIFLSYVIVKIRKKNLKSKTSNILIYTMIVFVILTLLDVLNVFFIKNVSLDLAIILLKIPLVIILVAIFLKLRKKGSL
ncbi:MULTISPECIES: hypothetical protein [unclassified Gemella]|uniref:hypothetical protein n=1 Tax=unclassified Gemella TaxID=2624949 RepID=UPI0015CFF7B7|nr:MULTISPECIES: hypothetical protein [unclassified Gemella]MBF0710355.1 hypothetical protein [Gemella sp. GL1.1]NYS27699.1 hypothetical protein [Gemella sp. GL1]